MKMIIIYLVMCILTTFAVQADQECFCERTYLPVCAIGKDMQSKLFNNRCLLKCKQDESGEGFWHEVAMTLCATDLYTLYQ